MKITKELLISKNACDEQVELFSKTFPNGTTVTKKACLLAHKVGLDFGWAVTNLFNPSQRKAYDVIEGPAWKTYQEIKGQARKAYYDVQGPAWETYKGKCAIAFYTAYKVK